MRSPDTNTHLEIQVKFSLTPKARVRLGALIEKFESQSNVRRVLLALRLNHGQLTFWSNSLSSAFASLASVQTSTFPNLLLEIYLDLQRIVPESAASFRGQLNRILSHEGIPYELNPEAGIFVPLV